MLKELRCIKLKLSKPYKLLNYKRSSYEKS